MLGTSLLVQWLRLSAPNAGGPGSIPGQGTRSHMLQLRPGEAKYGKGNGTPLQYSCLENPMDGEA